MDSPVRFMAASYPVPLSIRSHPRRADHLAAASHVRLDDGDEFLRRAADRLETGLEEALARSRLVQNGDRRGVLVLQNKASVLREKDIMQENEVTTPARRIYFPTMMMYLDEANAERYYDEFAKRLTEFMSVIGNPAILAECVSISKHCMQREYYKALMLCRKLIEYEDERLGNVPSGVPAGG